MRNNLLIQLFAFTFVPHLADCENWSAVFAPKTNLIVRDANGKIVRDANGKIVRDW